MSLKECRTFFYSINQITQHTPYHYKRDLPFNCMNF
jgi:hypothetical protein